ncbi:MAG: chemotaxis protein CheW [Oscillospiraceae bacterium]|jgi:purine-binding chemotaxis protein CheW|nr:chemotaxis protein CheW [Oscillospiraceae bacterium]
MQELMTSDASDAINSEDVMRGQYLTFRVKDGDYGIEIRYITEIIEVQNITNVPHTPGYVKGIINLRNTIVPVIDMGLRFSMNEIECTDRTCIIVLSMKDLNIGLIVDEVREVLTIDDENLQMPPAGKGGAKNEFVKAIGMYEDRINQLLDINKVFEVEEVTA